jgi:23S rRNA pseudouridine1911/1915/1917 synthase
VNVTPAEATVEFQVGEDAAGTRLDQVLAGSVGSRAQAQRLIDAGHVKVNGRVRSKRYLVHAGERIVAGAPPPPAAELDLPSAPYGIAYEDEHLLVADKPAGVVVHPARGHHAGTLSQALAQRGAHGGDPWRAGIVHRLDRNTSGLLVVAKNEDVHRELKQLLAERRLRREYLALVDGRPSARTGTVDAPIGRDRHDRLSMSIDAAEPREARTHFEIERQFPRATLLRVVLDTGRTHQIRVHMAAIGHPVCGDRQYGGSSSFGLPRQFLHAARLAFKHPETGARIDVRSELPADLADALARAADPG